MKHFLHSILFVLSVIFTATATVAADDINVVQKHIVGTWLI